MQGYIYTHTHIKHIKYLFILLSLIELLYIYCRKYIKIKHNARYKGYNTTKTKNHQA